MKQLERLLFLQGNRCFFCGHAIPKGEASVEHLVAAANGGGNEDENCVVCCRAVNAALGHLSVKSKLQAVLNQRGGFVCPASMGDRPETHLSSHAPDSSINRFALVVADLQKRGAARPRRISTLRNTMNAVFQMSLSETELDALVAELRSKRYVIIEDTKVSYSLPMSGG